MRLEYSPEQQKVIIHSNNHIEVLQQMQQQLDCIASVIHDSGFIPYLNSTSTCYPANSNPYLIDVHVGYYRVQREGTGITFDINRAGLKVDDKSVEVTLYHDQDGINDILKKVSQKYFINLSAHNYTNYEVLHKLNLLDDSDIKQIKELSFNPIVENTDQKEVAELVNFCNNISKLKIELDSLGRLYNFGRHEEARLSKLSVQLLKAIKDKLPQLTVLEIKGNITDEDYSLLCRWLGETKQYSTVNDITLVLGNRISDYRFATKGINELIRQVKNTTDKFVFLKLNSHFIGDDIKSQIEKLNDYTKSNYKALKKYIKDIAKVYFSSNYADNTDSADSNVRFDPIFIEMYKNDKFKLFWNMRDDYKLHSVVLNELQVCRENNSFKIRDLNCTPKSVEHAVNHFTRYITPKITHLPKQLPNEQLSKVVNVPDMLEKLPPEIQDKLIGYTKYDKNISPDIAATFDVLPNSGDVENQQLVGINQDCEV